MFVKKEKQKENKTGIGIIKLKTISRNVVSDKRMFMYNTNRTRSRFMHNMHVRIYKVLKCLVWIG